MSTKLFAYCIFLCLFAAGRAFASSDCSDALRGVRPSLEFSRSLNRSLAAVRLSESHFRELLRINDSELVDLSPGRAWMVIFEHDPNLADRGYIVKGFRKGKRFVVDEVRFAEHNAEVRYFRAIADARHIPEQTLMLKTAINNCRGLVVRATTQVKLWLKHQLRLEDVVEVMNSPLTEPALDRNHSFTYNNRFRYLGMNSSGRPIRTIIEVRPDCLHSLVTAFEEP